MNTLDPTCRPQVSVVVPVYNVEKYLARCLDSLIAQTERNLEIICVDDGSTDASGSILADYAAKDPRIQVMTQPNAGQAVARNRGMDAATGEFLCFVDSDDAAHPRLVERLLSAINETGADIAVNRGVAEMDALAAPPPLGMRRAAFHADALADLVADRRIYSSVWNKLYRAALLNDLRFKMPWHFFEDWPFLVKAFARAKNGYALVHEPLYFYNRESLTANSTVRGTFSARKVDGYLVGIRDVTELFRGRPEEPLARRRAAAAAKMLMSKARKLEPALRHRAVEGLEAILADGLLARRDLDLKTRWRIWRGKHG